MRSESFDIRPAHEASAADLSHRLFDDYRASTVSPEVIAANHRSNEEKYASLRCFDLIAHCPTVAGILLFGKNPRYFLPGAYVQFIRFPGTTMTERPIDQKEIDGDLRTVVEALRGRIDAHNAVALGEGAGSVTRDTLTRRNAYRNPVVDVRRPWPEGAGGRSRPAGQPDLDVPGRRPAGVAVERRW